MTGQRENVQSLAGGKGVARHFGGLAPAAVVSLQGEQLVDRGLHRFARLAGATAIAAKTNPTTEECLMVIMGQVSYLT